MIDYIFKFNNEASAIAALGEFIPDGENWDLSRVMASSRCGNTQPFFMYSGDDRIEGYFVSVSVSAVRNDLYVLPSCMSEGDRDSATILRTRLSDDETCSPIVAGMTYQEN